MKCQKLNGIMKYYDQLASIKFVSLWEDFVGVG